MLAYLDPASGSMILSVVAGGIAGIAVFFKSFGHRIWSAIAFWKKDDDGSADTADTADGSADAADGDDVSNDGAKAAVAGVDAPTETAS